MLQFVSNRWQGGRCVPEDCGSDNKALPFFFTPSNMNAYTHTAPQETCRRNPAPREGWVGLGRKRKLHLPWRAAGAWGPHGWGSGSWEGESRKGQERREAEVRASVQPLGSDVAGDLCISSIFEMASGSGVVPFVNHG